MSIIKNIPGIASDDSMTSTLRTLRLKFIGVNMLLAVLVLGLAFVAICYTDYTSRLNAVYSELDMVLTEAGSTHIPQIATIQPLKNSSSSAVQASSASTATKSTKKSIGAVGSSSAKKSSQSDSTNKSDKSSTVDPSTGLPMIGDYGRSNSAVILAAVYSVSPNGVYTVVSDFTNASIPESVILKANEAALENTGSTGYISDYDLYFERRPSTTDPGDYLIAYADGSSVNEWHNLAWMLGLALAGMLVVLFVANIFLSRWALRPVEVSMKLQQQFTADASHELKTPLTVILANMAILKSQPDAHIQDQMQWIDSTHTEAERMQLLVNDMLALSRPGSQKMNYVTEELDFSDLVEGEVLQFESVAFEVGVDLDSEIEEGLRVDGNPERLSRMVATLVDNACKYAGSSEESGLQPSQDDMTSEDEQLLGMPDLLGMPEQSTDADSLLQPETDEDAEDKAEMPRVFVTLARKTTPGGVRDKAELKVHNTGNPIPSEDLPHIFNRFYRADKVRTSSKGGYGLGLAIGQEIVIEHGGDIQVESSESNGTTFTVTLPLLD